MLLTNGCSFVWGDELEGYDQDPPTHREYTFTHHLSQHLRLPYKNLATCGACNTKIFRDTIDYLKNPDNQKPTHVVILWSAWQRQELAENRTKAFEEEMQIQRWQCMTQWSPTRMGNLKEKVQGPLEKALYYTDDVRTSIIHDLSYMHALELLCETMGIKLIQGTFHVRCWENILEFTKPRYHKTDAPWTDWINYVHTSLRQLKETSRIGLGVYKDFYLFAEDNYEIKEYGHPNEEAHEAYANLLNHIFNTQWKD